MKFDFHTLPPNQIERFLERKRARPLWSMDTSLEETLSATLRKAHEFVPSQAGAILLDDPKTKSRNRSENLLTFVASSGIKSRDVIGKQISADQGVAGHVYITGRSYHTDKAESDEFFYAAVDREIDYHTRSIVCIPILIEQEVCGVLELINRDNAPSFSAQDQNLLEIFAGYISISIQNILDGRYARELARRDNLTGLFNDRYLHIALSQAISACRDNRHDLALLFIDLDYFKHVNDTHGHLAGSQVLNEVGELLKQSVADRADAIAARYGGDEFVIAVPGTDLAGAVDLAESIRSSIQNRTFLATPGDIHPEALNLRGLTCSIGVANLKRHVPHELVGEDAKTGLLRVADVAMYVAKETGRNRTATASEPVPQRV